MYGLWGAGLAEDCEVKYTPDGRFRVLSDKEKEMLKKEFLEIPPVKNPIKKIELALDRGLPVEFLVDTGVIDDEKVYDIDIDAEERQFIIDYIKYKKDPEYSSEYASIYLAVKNIGVFEDVVEGLEGCDFLNIKPVIDFNDVKKVLSSVSDVVVVVGEGLSEEQKANIVSLHDIVESKNISKVKFIDSDGFLGEGENVYKLDIKGKYIRMAYNKKWDLIKNISNSDTLEEEVEQGVKEDITEQEGSVEEDVGYDSEEIGDSEKVEDEECVEVDESGKKFREEKEKLEELVCLKDKQIKSLEEQLGMSLDQVSNLRKSLKEAREELRGVAVELEGISEENTQLKEVKILYETIIDDYKELKNLEENYDELVKNIKDECEVRVDEYRKIAENAERSFRELKKSFDDYFESMESGVDIDFTVVTKAPVLYFRIIREPRYFYSMLKYLRVMLKSMGKKVLLLAVKDVGYYCLPYFDDWVEIDEIEEEVDLINSDDKVYVKDVSKKESLKLESLLGKYDFIIVLDYMLREKAVVRGVKTEEVFVIKDNRQRKDLMEGNKVLSEDAEESFIDISHNEKMAEFTNEKVKELYYRKRISPWLKGFLG